MPTIHRTTIVPYSCEKMYALVNDVKAYPEFLPWCSHSEIHLANEDEIRANITVTAAGFTKTFTTHNRLQKNKMIELRLVDGPFKQLEGFWRFTELSENSCQIEFDLQFEVAGGWFAFAFNPIFQQMANNLVEVFTTRAKEIYG